MTFMTMLFAFGPAIITSMAIIGVGYWVNETIRRKSQKDTVLVNYLQDIQRNIHKYIYSAIETNDFNQRTTELRNLSNEIKHFTDLQLFIEQKNKHNVDKLKGLCFKFKSSLTETGDSPNEEDLAKARLIANELKKDLLESIVDICESKK